MAQLVPKNFDVSYRLYEAIPRVQLLIRSILDLAYSTSLSRSIEIHMYTYVYMYKTICTYFCGMAV